jgi:hypothetical protein
MRSWGQLFSPLLSLVSKIQWWSMFPTVTYLRRQNSYLHSFHLGFLVKLNIRCHSNVVLNSHRDSALILHERFCAMDMLKAPTLETKNFTFYAHFWSLQSWLCLVPSASMRITTTYWFFYKLFKRMVVDAYVCHKHYKYQRSIVVLTLQLEHYCQMFGGKMGNYTTIDSCKRSSQGQA